MKRRTFLGGAAAAGLLPAVATARKATSVRTVDAVVIGAGLSGLQAASLLEADGRTVVVIEGRKRVGGRVCSLDDVNGHPEAGANSILAAYGRALDLARGFNLPLVDTIKRPPPAPAVLHVNGQTMTIAQWKESPLNPFVGDRRGRSPGALCWIEAAKFNPITALDGWCDPANAALDIPMTRFLAERGYSPAEIHLAHDVNPAYGRSAGEVSLLNWLYVDGFFKAQHVAGSQEYTVAGGNSRLPEAMAKALKSEILFGHKVVAITADGKGAEVRCADGLRIRARHVVCSMPLTTMRKVTFDPPLPPVHARAVQDVPHMQITQTHFEVSDPYWQQDGIAPDMWTDTDLGVLTSIRGGGTSTEITSLTAWARGDAATRVDRLGERAARAHVQSELERLRPAAKGKVRVAGFKSWQADEFALGDWVVWKPGQPTVMPKACGTAHGPIHFCGEHTAITARGMEGALESGERVALEILAP